ncbi:unnamed protein product [Chilo suppressalis]|uniref:Methylenetetrahydrofolate reductase (NAD(P)H) n=1 Tax=Chilo suppressalis TaxID=168631 RepID=A0ABN8AVH8_CHISP|nr:unnamed protein product [Chilo suppressalis]
MQSRSGVRLSAIQYNIIITTQNQVEKVGYYCIFLHFITLDEEMAKITDLLRITAAPSYSFEVTPDVHEADLDNLPLEPTFFSVTWHAKSHLNKDLDIAPLKLAKLLRSKNKNVLLHLTCDLLRKDYLSKLLQLLQDNGICNLFIMLGESYDPSLSDFQSSDELIKEIRREFGDYFCIGVAGMPDCNDERLLILKMKVNIGANFILTQAFFESDVFNQFTRKCKSVQIDVPIIPGVFYFEDYKQLNGFIILCKIKVSQNVLDYVKVKESTVNVAPGKEITRELIRSLYTEQGVNHFHLFTLNKFDRVCSFLRELEA